MPEAGTGFAATDAGTPAIAPPTDDVPRPARRKVEIIEDEDVGCSGKQRKKRKQRPRRQQQRPAEPDGGAAAAAADAGADADADRPLVPDLNYPPAGDDAHVECGMCAPPPCCYRKQVGRVYVCCERHDANGIPSVLCGWPACWAMQCFTQCLIWGIGGPVFLFSFPHHDWWVIVLGCGLLLLVSFALFRVGTSDPGMLPIYRERPGEEHRNKPPGPDSPAHNWQHYPRAGSDAWVRVPHNVRTTWCGESAVLVRNYDHFCPWTGTTIAGGNMCCFHTFGRLPFPAASPPGRQLHWSCGAQYTRCVCCASLWVSWGSARLVCRMSTSSLQKTWDEYQSNWLRDSTHMYSSIYYKGRAIASALAF